MLSVLACVERKRLLHEYHECLKAYSEMVTVLDEHATCRDFAKTYERAEGIRLQFERARAELQKQRAPEGKDTPKANASTNGSIPISCRRGRVSGPFATRILTKS